MIKRTSFIEQLSTALRRSPVTALLGPRQCGKTTLARTFGQNRVSVYEISLQNTLRLAAGMNACLTEGVIRGSGASPLSS